MTLLGDAIYLVFAFSVQARLNTCGVGNDEAGDNRGESFGGGTYV